MSTQYTIPNALKLLCAGLIMLTLCVYEGMTKAIWNGFCWLVHNFLYIVAAVAILAIVFGFVPFWVSISWLLA